jgi:FkbM family methyltransferase
VRFPILGGPLRGSWWLLQKRGQLGPVLFGRYEPEHTAIFVERIGHGATVVDVGAHVGYYTLLAARLTGGAGSVIAFEPDPANCAVLRRHVKINGYRNVAVEQAAVADRNGSEEFTFGRGSGTGHLGVDGSADRPTVVVPTLDLDSYLGSREARPSFIKIDAEGAEVRVLRGASRVLKEHRPVLVLSTHWEEGHLECIDILQGLGYSLAPILGESIVRTSELLCLPS